MFSLEICKIFQLNYIKLALGCKQKFYKQVFHTKENAINTCNNFLFENRKIKTPLRGKEPLSYLKPNNMESCF